MQRDKRIKEDEGPGGGGRGHQRTSVVRNVTDGKLGKDGHVWSEEKINQEISTQMDG